MIEQTVHLQKHKKLHLLCEILRETQPNWSKVYASLSASSLLVRRGQSEENIRGHLLEQHITLIIWSLIKQNLGINEVTLPQQKVLLPNFSLERPDPQTLEYATYFADGSNHSDYDAHFVIDDEDGFLPTIAESTTCSIEGLTFKEQTLRENAVKKHLAPLSEYYNTSAFGYIFCMLELVERKNKVRRKLEVMRRAPFMSFTDRNGYIVQVPVSSKEVHAVSQDYLSSLK